MAKMKKYASLTDEKINEIVAAYDDTKLKKQEGCFARDLAKLDFPFKKKKSDGTTIWVTKDYMTKIHNAMVAEIAKRNGKTVQETDVPAPVVEIPIPTMAKETAPVVENPTPTMAKETAPETSDAGEKNVKKVLHKKSQKSVAKPKKNCYINDTNKTKTTKTGDKTMNNEIAKIAPDAVKNILAAQKTNKTDTKKTYWGGWAKVHAGMNAAYNDYEKFQNLETEWLELRQKLGGTKSPLYHFCWKLINSNRVGVKQEPNATLRFIKNAKIRIAMANDVLANKNKYKNEIAENWKATFGTEI